MTPQIPASRARASYLSFDEHRHDQIARQIFHAIRTEGAETIQTEAFFRALERAGLSRRDRRLTETWQRATAPQTPDMFTETDFEAFLPPENATLIYRALSGDLVIPDFFDFRNRVENIFEFCRDFQNGEVASYIPQLARVDPEMYALACTTIDGQQFSFGNDDEIFCAQSTCKPVTYAIALDTVGRNMVHQHVGREPSGRSFNELTLNANGLPHNPMINAGAIICASLIRPHLSLADRFDYVMGVWRALTGGRKVSFDNSIYLSEKETADRNFALAYFMRENGAFPPNTDIIATLDFYFQCCSITMDVRQMANVAATLANGGICPMSNQRVFQSETVKNCLSLMYSCGMYDFSGEYAFTVGLPAKSGVSGAMYIVVPGVCGFALWSPRLDALGNTVRGVEFSKRLVDVFAFHQYANLINDHRLIDPLRAKIERRSEEAAYLCAAAARGDLGELRRLRASGYDLDVADYDGRTALHLAASEGQLLTLSFLLDQCLTIDPRDRWGNTPLDDARRENRADAVPLIEKALEKRTSAIEAAIGQSA